MGRATINTRRIQVWRIFLQGLAALLPVAFTAYLLIFSAIAAEHLFAGLLRPLLPEGGYIPGSGILVGLLLIFAFGLLMHFLIVERLFRWTEGLLERVPIVKSIYTMTRDFVEYFAKNKEARFNQVVMVTLPELEARVFGFVTRETFDDLPDGVGDAETVAVYLPMSYQIGGYTLYLPRSRIQPIAMSLEEGMRFALTAGVSRVTPTAVKETPGLQPESAPDPAP